MPDVPAYARERSGCNGLMRNLPTPSAPKTWKASSHVSRRRADPSCREKSGWHKGRDEQPVHEWESFLEARCARVIDTDHLGAQAAPIRNKPIDRPMCVPGGPVPDELMSGVVVCSEVEGRSVFIGGHGNNGTVCTPVDLPLRGIRLRVEVPDEDRIQGSPWPIGSFQDDADVHEAIQFGEGLVLISGRALDPQP